MSRSSPPGWLRRLFAAALRLHPPRGRARYAGEAREAFAAGWHRRRAAGRGSATAWALRAVVDAARSGLAERRRTRRPRGGSPLGDLGGDVRLAIRALRRSPGFALAAVSILALGIGANAAVFTAVRGTLLAPPPFHEPESLVVLDLTESSTVREGPERSVPWSLPKYRVLEDTPGRLVDPVAAFASRTVTLTGAGDAARLPAELVTWRYMEVLAERVVVGRGLDAGDETEGAAPVALLGHALWRERFGGRPDVVGRQVWLDGHAFTVVGVAPRGFRGLTGAAELWLPARAAATLYGPFMVEHPQTHWLRAVGRLRPGTTLAAVDDQMDAVAGAVTAAHPDSDPTVVTGADAQPLAEARTNLQARSSLLVMAAAAALLLLVACANLAGLLLARTRLRSRETAVRVAMGAGRWRAARGFLVESLLLAAAGGVAAVGVAWLGADILVAAWPERFLDGSWNLRFARLDAVRVDRTVLAYAGGVAALSGLLFGAAPALAAGGAEPGDALRRGGATARGRRRDGGVRSALVAGEIALALVLLLGAGLLVRSLERLQAVDRGFRPGALLTFQVTRPGTGRPGDEAGAFYEAYLERLRGLPGVEDAGLGCGAPLSGHCWIVGVSEAGGRTWSEGRQPDIGVHPVDDAYFRTLGIEVHRGRTFTPDDRAGGPRVVVLNEAAARTLFPDGEALGRRITLGIVAEGEDGSARVVGVVADVLYDRPEQGVMPEAYVSHRQEGPGGTVFVRTRGEPLAVVPAARAALAELDPDIPLHGVRTLDDLEAGATADTRVLGALLSVFATLALVLACTGVWAVVAYAVTARTRELGLRVALGADPRDVVALVVRKGLAVAAVGMVVGAAGAALATRLLRGLLFGVSATDPLTFLGGVAVLLSVATLAAWLPARRATRVDPMVALRAD